MENGIVIVSPHFRRIEFACHDGCGFESVDVELLILLEEIRREFNRKVKIISGCRCEAWNRHIRGAEDSFHVKGMAADFRVEHTPSHVVQDFFDDKYPDKYGLGRYRDYTHADVRRKKARWEGD